MARKRLTKKTAVSSSPYEEEEQLQNDTVETQQQQNSAGDEEEDDGLSSKSSKRGTRSETVQMSQRVWSVEDEMAILKGIIAYHKGKSPLVSNADLFEFVKGSFQFNRSLKQFSDKISKLKKKYFTDVENNKNGTVGMFSTPHDLECTKLANKIWGAGGIYVGSRSGKSVTHGGGGGGGSREIDGGGSHGGDEDFSGEGKGKGGKKEKKKMTLSEEVGEKINENDGKNEKGKVVLNEEVHEVKGKGRRGGEKRKRVVNEEINGEQEESEDFWEKYPYLRSSLRAENLPENVKETAMVMLGTIPKDTLLELETTWKSLKNAKLELLKMKEVLITKQIKLGFRI